VSYRVACYPALPRRWDPNPRLGTPLEASNRQPSGPQFVYECVYGLRDGAQRILTAIVVDPDRQPIRVSVSQEIGATLDINAGEIAENPHS